MTVVGRFAPSPTGPLHFGSVVAALASYLNARSRNGQWLLRIDDLDQPRVQPGAADDILRTLEALGLTWDGELVYQSQRSSYYAEAFARLRQADRVYPCACTRREVGRAAYPGTCRDGLPAGRSARAWRLRVPTTAISLVDQVQGPYEENLATTCGDFIVRRADGLFAYHLACVIDDAAAGVNEIIRGVDLLASTPRQLLLQRYLGLPVPDYGHVPVVLGERGHKLSKQTQAPAVGVENASSALCAALDFLGLSVPHSTAQASVDEIVSWALANWSLSQVGSCSRAFAWP